jgi:hypothetical protein
MNLRLPVQLFDKDSFKHEHALLEILGWRGSLDVVCDDLYCRRFAQFGVLIGERPYFDGTCWHCKRPSKTTLFYTTRGKTHSGGHALMQWLTLYARPRAAPIARWPHDVTSNGVVFYRWVCVKPDGSGWSINYDDSFAFPEQKLAQVLEAFYEGSAESYPFDFTVEIADPPPAPPARQTKATARAKKLTKSKKRRKKS